MYKYKILFKITGSIAAYKSAYLISRLSQNNCDVIVVASENGLKFIGIATVIIIAFIAAPLNAQSPTCRAAVEEFQSVQKAPLEADIQKLDADCAAGNKALEYCLIVDTLLMQEYEQSRGHYSEELSEIRRDYWKKHSDKKPAQIEWIERNADTCVQTYNAAIDEHRSALPLLPGYDQMDDGR